MSSLDPRIEEQNRRAFLVVKKIEQHEREVAAWLRSRPEVGVLTGKTNKYYVYPAGDRYSEVAEFS